MKKILILILLIVLTLCALLGSLLLGFTKIDFMTLIASYRDFNGSNDHLVVTTLRVPRALIALTVGSSLSVSGVLIQAVSRNPMASPSLLGINSGAAFFLVAAMSLFPSMNISGLAFVSFSGALFCALLVFTIAGGFKGKLHSLNLTLSGAAISFLFISLTQGILARDQRALEETLFWLAGSVSGRSLASLKSLLIYMIIGTIIAFSQSRKLSILSLGEEVAIGLGANTTIIKLWSIIAIILLAGSSVAIAGPISLVGLVIPHFARIIAGSSYRWILLFSTLLGSLFLLTADILSRFIIYPNEAPVGVLAALLGAPLFIYISRKVES